MDIGGFSSSELKLPYDKWKQLVFVKRDRHLLDHDVLEWLDTWEKFDMSISPMPDDVRISMRFAHYRGYFRE